MTDQQVDHRAEAHSWRQRIARIEHEIRTAEKVIADAEAVRASLALAVLNGADPKELEHHRQQVDHAKATLEDKRAVLAAAREELAKAEWAETAAKRQAARDKAKELIRARIAAAVAFDCASEALQKAYSEHERLGQEILNLPDLALNHAGGSLALVQGIRSHDKIDGALPPLLDRIFPNLIRSGYRGPLSRPEAAMWRTLGID